MQKKINHEEAMNDIIFATAINCIDGRIQVPVIDWIKMKYAVHYVDMITEAGPNKILVEDRDKTVIASIKKRVEISVTRHESKLIAIVGHHDCAGNPSEKETQLKQIRSAINKVKSWNFEVQLIGLWVDHNFEVSQVE